MKIVLQRVKSANVKVDNKIIGEIKKGLVLFVGISKDFNENKCDWIIDKILKLRLWSSEKKGFDLSIKDIDGEILIISQFTLFGDCKKGTKPNFAKAGEYIKSEKIYNKFISKIKKQSKLKIKTGEFGSMMDVELINDGPVTIILEK